MNAIRLTDTLISTTPIRRPRISRETALCAAIILPAAAELIYQWWRFLA